MSYVTKFNVHQETDPGHLEQDEDQNVDIRCGH